MKKINFYVLNEKGYVVIRDFLEKYSSNYIDYVVIGKDRNIKNDYSIEIENLCRIKKIKYYFKGEPIVENENYTFAIGWRWIIKNTKKLIVIHDSLLPKYRGFAPLVNALINKESEIGVTALFASDEYDKGDIIEQLKINIEYPIKINEAIKRIAQLYSKVVLKISRKIIDEEELIAEKQDESKASYSLWRDCEDYFIDWNKSAEYIRRFVDSLGSPYEGAKTYIGTKVIIVEDVEVLDDVHIINRDVGKVIYLKDNKYVVVCKIGLIKIISAKYEETKKSIYPIEKFRLRFK